MRKPSFIRIALCALFPLGLGLALAAAASCGPKQAVAPESTTTEPETAGPYTARPTARPHGRVWVQSPMGAAPRTGTP